MAASPTPPGRKECRSTRSAERVKWEWVTSWLEKAQNDLLAGEAIVAVSMPSYETASFHAQQAGEKSLKALIIRHQIEFTRTHDLGELLGLAEPAAPGISRALVDAETLNPHASIVAIQRQVRWSIERRLSTISRLLGAFSTTWWVF